MSTLFQILSIIVLFQLFFISFFLVSSRKGRKLSNVLLALFFISLGLGLLDYVLLLSGFFNRNPQFAFVLNGLVIFHAPLLLLYTQSLTSANFRIKPMHLLHALPYFMSLGLLIVFYYSQSHEIQQLALTRVKEGRDISNILITSFGLIYEMAYLIAVKMQVARYQRQIREQFSNLDKVNLNWLNFLVNIFIVSFLASMITNVVRHSSLEHLKGGAIIIGLIGLLFFINSVLLKGLHQNEMFLGSGMKSDPDIPDHSDRKILIAKLKRYLADNKPFLDPELTVSQLADLLAVPARQLSSAINTELGQSFFDLINQCRIEEAKRLIRETKDPKLTIQEVMYQVGFNSKSSFNTAFKKYTGKTPSQFKGKV